MDQDKMIRKCKEIKKEYSTKFLVAISVFCLFIIALQQNSLFASAQDEQKILTIAMNEDIDSPNPYVGVNDNSYVFFGMIYDSLISPDGDLVNGPNLASSWHIINGNQAAASGTDFSTPDFLFKDPADWPLGSIWDYNLTEDVFWADGVPFNADDVEWTFNIQLGSNFNIFWAYQPYTRWISHVEKVDDYKVRIFFSDFDTKQPTSVAFGNNLFIPIMPKHLFAGKETTYLAQSWNGVPAIGTGPFKGTQSLAADIIAKESVILTKNQFYDFIDDDGIRKGLGAKYNRTIEIDKLVLKFFSEESTLGISIKSGDCDCGELPPTTFLVWENDETIPNNLDQFAMLSSTAFSKQVVINDYAEAVGDLNPLRLDPAVQRAATLATNKTYIKDVVFKGLAEIGVSLISPVWPEWYWEPGEDLTTFNVTDGDGNVIWSYTKPMIEAMSYNLTLANQILDAAGYEWTGAIGESPRKASQLVADRMQYLFGSAPGIIKNTELRMDMIVGEGDSQDKAVGDYLISEWEEIGLWIETSQGDHSLSLVNSATWNSQIYSYLFNTMQTYWSGDIDPNYLCYVPSSYSLYGWNEFGTNDTEYDVMYYHQATAIDKDTRKYWVDKCLEWQYLSGSIITTVYPKICFAINSHLWKNWGNWTDDPGMAIDAFWGENPLWWHLTYEPDDPAQIDVVVVTIVIIVSTAAIFAPIFLHLRRDKTKDVENTEEEE